MEYIRNIRQTLKSNDQAEPSQSNCLRAAKEKLVIFKDSGVEVDGQTRVAGGILLLPLIPYITVQLVDIFNTATGTRVVTLIALIVSALCLISYFTYQILDPLVQQRSLHYFKYEKLISMDELEKLVLKVTKNSNIDQSFAVTEVMKAFDFNGDECITEDEFNEGYKKLMIGETDKSYENNIGPTSKNIFDENIDQQYAVTEVRNSLDINDDRLISKEELITGFETNEPSKRYGSTSKNVSDEVFKEDDPYKVDKIMSKVLKHAETQILKSESLITLDGKPNIDAIHALFQKLDPNGDQKITTSELGQFIRSVGFGGYQPKYEYVVKEMLNEFQKDSNSVIDKHEFLEGISKWVNKAVLVANTPDKLTSIDLFDKMVWKEAAYDSWDLIISVFQVILGIVILTFLGGPLMNSILQSSYSMSIPSFSISFVIVPLAMNARATITAIRKLLLVIQKSPISVSLTFSEVYGGVIMNNIVGLTTLLAIVYAKDLTWNFSAEVMTVLLVCAVIGLLAYTCNTYPLWTCVLAFFLYPFSLGLCYFVQVYLSWN